MPHAGATTIKLDIEGMSCNHCVSAVTSALRKLDGVEVRNVSIGEATVDIEPDKANPETVAAAVSDAGYQARVLNA